MTPSSHREARVPAARSSPVLGASPPLYLLGSKESNPVRWRKARPTTAFGGYRRPVVNEFVPRVRRPEWLPVPGVQVGENRQEHVVSGKALGNGLWHRQRPRRCRRPGKTGRRVRITGQITLTMREGVSTGLTRAGSSDQPIRARSSRSHGPVGCRGRHVLSPGRFMSRELPSGLLAFHIMIACDSGWGNPRFIGIRIGEYG